jgi:hypothetical protein
MRGTSAFTVAGVALIIAGCANVRTVDNRADNGSSLTGCLVKDGEVYLLQGVEEHRGAAAPAGGEGTAGATTYRVMASDPQQIARNLNTRVSIAGTVVPGTAAMGAAPTEIPGGAVPAANPVVTSGTSGSPDASGGTLPDPQPVARATGAPTLTATAIHRVADQCGGPPETVTRRP